MSNNQEFILFIPGFGSKEPKEYLDKLVEGIKSYCADNNGYHFEELNDSQLQGTEQRRIKVSLPNNSTKIIGIQEVYWRDLRTLLSPESGVIQVIRGLEMLWFWTTSRKLWQKIFSSKYIFFWAIATLIVSIAWYYSVLATTFTAIGTNPEILNFELPANLADFFKELGSKMGGWNALAITSILMLIFPVKEVIDISYSTKCYLENYKGTKHKVYSRVNNALKAVTQSSQNNEQSNSEKNEKPRPDYERITVLSHSFGTIISTELLAEYEGQPSIRNITLGGALLIITARSIDVKDALRSILVNNKITSWIDFYSNHDWLCTMSPVSSRVDKFEGRQITTSIAFDQKIKGISHDLYFKDYDVIRTLLE